MGSIRKIVWGLFLLFSPILCVAKRVVLDQDSYVQNCIYDNTTYVITMPIDLGGGSLELPKYSLLKFEKKGAIINGSVKGNNTKLGGRPCFIDVHLDGTFVNTVFRSSWCYDPLFSDFFENVMNLSPYTKMYVDSDVIMSDSKRSVDHISLSGKKGRKHVILNSDRFSVVRGGCEIENLIFRWDKRIEKDIYDNYSAVVIYSDLLLKDTTITTRIQNVIADGGGYCSYFMKQYKSGITSLLMTSNDIINCTFTNFTRGVIRTCGGGGRIVNSSFNNIGYESNSLLQSVSSLHLGVNNYYETGKTHSYVIDNCSFVNTVAPYNSQNDGRELHAVLVYGDYTSIKNNQFINLSTSFNSIHDTGRDSEIVYIKGSHNIIENNIFENGAGTLSDAVITLKEGGTENNIIRNNVLLNSAVNSRFIYLSGNNHLIQGNKFSSLLEAEKGKTIYSIYLAHHDLDQGKESVTIANNVFLFSPKSNVSLVFSNNWYELFIKNNAVINSRMFLKMNNRTGKCIVDNNVFSIKNVFCESEDYFISSSTSSDDAEMIISKNRFLFKGISIGRFISGNNIDISGNSINVEDSCFGSLIRGKDAKMKVVNNYIRISHNSIIQRNAIVGETKSSLLYLDGNSIVADNPIMLSL